MSDTPKPTPGPWTVGTSGLTVIPPDGASFSIPSATHGLKDCARRARLIVAACNACQQVNPEHPQAVAEALPRLVTLLHNVARTLDALAAEWDDDNPQARAEHAADVAMQIRAALAKAEGRPTP